MSITSTSPAARATFADLGVPSFICEALARRDITEPFEIQAVTIADMLAGRDVCGRAPTGSGKTLAFGVPVVASTKRSQPGRPGALILAPTRELAEQITTDLRSFAGNLRIDSVYGGVGYGGQLSALRRGVDILVACPGRLEDLIEGRHVDLSAVRCVVLDEADRMADMGFMPSVKRLLDRTPRDRQTVLFSATLDGDVAKLTRDYQRDPVRHEVGDETPNVQAATHRFWKVSRDNRNDVLADVVKAAWPAIIFTRTRHGADRLVKQLSKLEVEGVAIHGGLSQNTRNRALDSFAKGRVHALIATDVAARGIHVDGVASVVHYDPPEDHKAYVHRSGRTARAGAAGLVVSLLQPEQVRPARKMQGEIGLDEDVVFPDHATLPASALDAGRALAPAGPASAPQAPAKQRNGPRQRSGRSGGRDGGRSTRSASTDRTPDWSPRESRPSRDDSRSQPRSNDSRRSGAGRADARPDDRRGSTSSARGGEGSGRPNGAGAPSNGRTRARTSNGGTPNARANRAARRAHLQPGSSRSR